MCTLPNDIIRVLYKIITPFTRSKLCQINKQYYNVIITLTNTKMNKHRYHGDIRNYHLFILSGKQLLPEYLTDGNIDVDVAKLIWKYRHARLKKCYDILFNAYRCGNIEYINFIQPEIYKLCDKRHAHWNRARLRGAIAGNNTSFVQMLWNGYYNNNFWYAYECGHVNVVKLIKEKYGCILDDRCISKIYEKKRANVLYYEYTASPNRFNPNMVTYMAIRKKHVLLLKALIDNGIKFSDFDISHTRTYRCNNEFIQLMLDNKV